MSRNKMESPKDVIQEVEYTKHLISAGAADRIDKLSPGQYSIDWAAYNNNGNVVWWGEFKRRYRPLEFFEGGVIGISAYKIAKLKTFIGVSPNAPALFFLGLDDCILIGNVAMHQPVACKFGGNPNPKDEFEQEPMCYYKVNQLRRISIVSEKEASTAEENQG